MANRSPLDDPEYAAFAWARYKRLMRGMTWFTLACVIVSLALLFWSNGFISWHFYIAAALGIGFTVILTAALMGLVFLSSGTGHDESIEDPFKGSYDGDD